ncbi:hypothetical protein [Paenibacillus phocaensis]|uniref:hypothetical protein n=1 Tax=Paenibacillus phocaensis TaxID=1776378 RepID=UPI000839B7D9|nr:hypothetical protein [Paenibacillus phocaensis]
MDNQSPKSKNNFVRALLVLFILYLIGIITFAFFKKEPSYTLTPEYITLFVLITLLILSESFDNLSMGKILSLSREVSKKSAEVKEVKKENTELRDHIIKMTTLVNQNQHQSNMTFHGVTPELLQMIGVIKAKDKKDDENETELVSETSESVQSNSDLNSCATVNNPKPLNRRSYFRVIEIESIDRYLFKYNIPEGNIIRDAQFTPAFKGLDPIMERRIIFDAYLNTELKEYFFEVLLNITPVTIDRMYVQLSKIHYYSQAKNIKAQLVLLLIEFPKELEEFYNKSLYRPQRVLEAFQPAISNDLLRVETIAFSMDDVERWNKELEKPH